MSKGKDLLKCLACGSKNLKPVLDLGNQPLANSYLKAPSDPEDKFPLALNVCDDCWHCQLSYTVNPNLMFKEYLYVSGTSKTLRDYMTWFANFAYEAYRDKNRRNPTNFLDIACNDGTQLDAVKKLGLDTYGIDPADNLFEISSKNHYVACDYLTDRNYFNGATFDIINAQNVFAHNTNPVDFLKNCKRLLNAGGLIFIQNSQADMIKNGEFDTMYHEHVSFWNASSINAAAERAGLIVVDRIRVPVHGTSDLFVLKKYEFPSGSYRFDNALEMERSAGLHDMKIYREFGNKARASIKGFEIAMSHMQRDYPDRLYVGFGAAAKGMTFLNSCGITLDYIIDENPLKQGLYTPGSHIPIVGPDVLATNNDLIIVPLAWNFKEEIFRKVKEARPNEDDRYVQHLPITSYGKI